MRLIDADELTNEVVHDMAIAALHSNVKYFSIVNDIVVAFSETIDNAPTIDAEPVVRCKDCWKLNRLKKYTGFGEVQFVCENTKMTVYETDFCSYGERREP